MALELSTSALEDIETKKYTWNQVIHTKHCTQKERNF